MDTRVKVLNWHAGKIGGCLAPFGSAHRLTRAGITNLSGYRGHYLSKNTELAINPRGVYLNADHHHDLGAIGVVNRVGADYFGLKVEATLFANAAQIAVETADRRLPTLLQAGKLYYCCEFWQPKIAADGELLFAVLWGVALTEHPGVSKDGQ